MRGNSNRASTNASQPTKARQLAAALVLVFAVLATACSTSNVVETSVDASAAAGSESDASTAVDRSDNTTAAPTAPPTTTDDGGTAAVSSTPAPAPTRPPARPTAAPATGGGDTSAAVGIGTCPSDFIGAGTYIVTNIAANDPDGGLVGHTAPGADAPVTDVLPADYGVWVDGSAESCAVLENGAVWWAVHVGEGIYDWVNAYYLGYYEGPGNRPVVGGNQLCDSYFLLLEAQETDIPVTQSLINIDVELGGHPTGVTNAIYNMVNGFSNDWYSDLATIQAYVDPICVTSAVSPNPPTVDEPEVSDPLVPQLIVDDADYWQSVELCWFDADQWSCGKLEGSGYTSDSNYGLGNSVSQTPWEFVVDTCAAGLLESQFYCREAWSRYDFALAGTDKDYLEMCGKIAQLALDRSKPGYHLDWALTFFSWDPVTSAAIASFFDNTADANTYDVMQAGFVGQCEGWY